MRKDTRVIAENILALAALVIPRKAQSSTAPWVLTKNRIQATFLFRRLCSYVLALVLVAPIFVLQSGLATATPITISDESVISDLLLSELIENLGDNDIAVRNQAAATLLNLARQPQNLSKIQAALIELVNAAGTSFEALNAANAILKDLKQLSILADDPLFFDAIIGRGPRNDVGFSSPNWTLSLTFTEISRQVTNLNDNLRIEGYIQHLVAPHDGEAVPNPNKLNIAILIDPAPRNPPTDFGPLVFGATEGSVSHPGGRHIDVFQIFGIDVERKDVCLNNIPDITDPDCIRVLGISDWQFRIHAHHAPEPSTLILLGVGLVLLVAVGRKVKASEK